MSEEMQVNVTLEAGLDGELDTIAAALNRPKAWVIEQAVRDFVALQAWQLAAIDEGLQAADSDRVVSHRDVQAWVGSWDSPEEQPAPECG